MGLVESIYHEGLGELGQSKELRELGVLQAHLGQHNNNSILAFLDVLELMSVIGQNIELIDIPCVLVQCRNWR